MSHLWDVVVVGAGPAGCMTAEHLVQKGLDVVVVDAGPFPEEGESFAEVERRQWPFRVVGESYDWYRIRGVGGRSHLWGGWCTRFPEETFLRGGWPLSFPSMEKAYQVVEQTVSLQTGLLSQRFSELGRSLELRIHPKIGAYQGLHQVWQPLSLSSAQHAKTYLPALCLEHDTKSVTSLNCLDMRSEKEVQLQARSYVLAASPIETTRLLLNSEMGGISPTIGQGFVDHMVASYVLLEPEPPEPCNDSLGVSALVDNFVNMDDESQRTYPGGFTIELTGPLPLSKLDLERMVPASEVDSWRATQIHAMGECFPYSERYISLDTSEVDCSGRPIPCIHMAWSDAERDMAEDMKQACSQLADSLAIPGSKLLKFRDPLTAGAGHEAGACTMGNGPDEPCSSEGKLKALDNLWIADASTWPTSGDRHPTLTLLAQAIRVADSCAQWLNAS